MDWMQDLMESIDELESPKNYFYWSALATISAVVGKSVYINRGGVYNLYPNVYVFLISKKSGLRKGVPINFAKKLAHECGKVRVIDGQNSIQGVLKELGQVITLPSQHIVKTAQGFLISGEFASFILTDGIGFSLTTLTDLHDTGYHEHGFSKRLASQDRIDLKEPCLTSLFASNATHFFDSVPKNAIAGGFLARTFCIYEEKRNTKNSLMRPLKRKINYNLILEHLKELTILEGPFALSDGATKAFDIWYDEFTERNLDDETGTDERIGDQILKAAMLISLSRSTGLVITEEDMNEAIDKSISSFMSMRRLLFGGNKSDDNIKAVAAKLVMTMMLESPDYEVSRKAIMIRAIGLFGPYELDETIEHFLQAKIMTIDKRGGEQYYKLRKEIVERHMSLSREDLKEG